MQHSTGYIIGFAAAVCLVCSVFVAGSAVSLKSRQEANVLLDRQSNVLVVAGLMKEDESISAEEIARRFDESIKPRIVELASGEYADDAVDVDEYDQRRATRDPEQSESAPDNRAKVRRLPKYALVYHVMSDAGEVESIILPIHGAGLWSTLYGYLALATDLRTIRGITFYEHGETPGLGGEVDNPRWKNLWKGRHAYDERWNPKIAVIKGSAGPPDQDPYRVDGLSGATITARGVSSLVQFWLGDAGFAKYLENIRSRSSEREV